VSRGRLALAALALSLLTAAGCGDEPATPVAPVRPPLPQVPDIPVAERAAFALRCLTHGPPRNAGRVPVPEIHRVNLDLALRDLRAMATHAVRLLRDPERRRRVVEGGRASADPWINVLRLLQAIPNPPLDVVLAWAHPVLEMPRRPDFMPLRHEAVRALIAVEDPATADALMGFVEQDPQERDVIVTSLPALLRYGEPWRTRAVDIVLRRAGPRVWEQLHDRLATLAPRQAVDARVADLLAWWSWVAEGSGPRLSTRLPRIKVPAWQRARLAWDPAVPRVRVAGAPDVPAYGPLPASVVRSGGWLATDLAGAAVFPTFGYGLTGKLPAADARCALARFGYATYVVAVEADLAGEEGRDGDEGLYYAARHCMLDPGDPQLLVDAKAKLTALLDEPSPEHSLLRAQEIQRLIGALPPCRDPAVWDLLVRILRELRPSEPWYKTAIQLAYDAMAPRDAERVEVVTELFECGEADLASRGIALTLIQASRSAAYVPLLEAELAATDDDTMRRLLRRLLIYIHAGGAIEPRRLDAFVQRFVGWIDEGDDSQLAALAAALTDFGEPGIAAFARGLRGPRRAAWIRAWPRTGHVMPRTLAEVMVEPMDGATPRETLAYVLGLAYTAFPARAAPALVALDGRLGRDLDATMEPLIERVRHRAPSEADDQ
jgi:hypothetical protein